MTWVCSMLRDAVAEDLSKALRIQYRPDSKKRLSKEISLKFETKLRNGPASASAATKKTATLPLAVHRAPRYVGYSAVYSVVFLYYCTLAVSQCYQCPGTNQLWLG